MLVALLKLIQYLLTLQKKKKYAAHTLEIHAKQLTYSPYLEFGDLNILYTDETKLYILIGLHVQASTLDYIAFLDWHSLPTWPIKECYCLISLKK